MTAVSALEARTPFWRAATTRLVARRATSHSKGPGRVSSKSRRSKLRLRSGVAHRPKFRTWASPQSCTWIRLCVPRRQVRRHDRGGAPIEVPRRHRHALVSQRHDFGQPDVVLRHERGDRVVPPGLLVPVADAEPAARAPAPGGPISCRSAPVANRSCRASTGVGAAGLVLLTVANLPPSRPSPFSPGSLCWSPVPSASRPLSLRRADPSRGRRPGTVGPAPAGAAQVYRWARCAVGRRCRISTATTLTVGARPSGPRGAHRCRSRGRRRGDPSRRGPPRARRARLAWPRRWSAGGR